MRTIDEVLNEMMHHMPNATDDWVAEIRVAWAQAHRERDDALARAEAAEADVSLLRRQFASVTENHNAACRNREAAKARVRELEALLQAAPEPPADPDNWEPVAHVLARYMVRNRRIARLDACKAGDCGHAEPESCLVAAAEEQVSMMEQSVVEPPAEALRVEHLMATLPKPIDCPNCEGEGGWTGRNGAPFATCPVCQGAKRIRAIPVHELNIEWPQPPTEALTRAEVEAIAREVVAGAMEDVADGCGSWAVRAAGIREVAKRLREGAPQKGSGDRGE